MAAYAAVTSLLNTLSQVLEAPNYPYQQHIKYLDYEVVYLRYFLYKNLEVKREFETQIRDVIYEAQDIVDSHLQSTHDFLSPSEGEISSQSFCVDLERLIQKVNSISDMVKSEKFTHQTLERKISISVLRNPYELEFPLMNHLVGRHNDIVQLQDRLTKGTPGLEVVPIVGIAGIGKTELAYYIINNHQEIRKHFGINAWAKVPIEYQKRHVLLDLLESMKKVGDGIHQMTDEQLAKLFYNSLKRNRYLVLLDDIREIEVWNDLKELFPNYYDGSRILLTTRNVGIAHIVGIPHLLDRVSDKNSLIMLQDIVFQQERCCPSKLYVIMKAIAESCKGHPHAVKMVGQLLRYAKRIPEYWEMVLSSINACDNYGNLIETLVSLTYKHLHQALKACVLYMAMFPYEYNIHYWTLQELCVAEGFIKLHNLNSSSREDMSFSIECFQQLSHRDLLSYNDENTREKITIKIRDEVFHDFLMRTAKEEKFFLAINKDINFGDSLQEEYKMYNQQRRLFIRKNIIPFIYQNNSSNTFISNARSLLYYGPKPQYPLSAWFDFELLRVLDILKVRFYSFPHEILNSIQLRYLALSYNGQLPAAMCRLRNLQFLIVLRYLTVKSSGAPSYLPLDIWNMKALRTLKLMGSDLPEPPSDTDLKLENLLALLGVSSHSCTRAILERIPNLFEFEIQIESLVEDECLSFFSHLHILNKLSIFKCVVVYPNIRSPVGPCFIPSFPSTLVHLNLSGCGFPWDYMSVIAALPNLLKLILQNYAFQGPEWEVKKDEFLKLDFLLLEDMDLKNWILADQFCFPKMKNLSIRHCYKLREVPNAIGDIPTLKMLKVVDCSTSAMDSAGKIEEEKHSQGNDSVKFILYSSRDD